MRRVYKILTRAEWAEAERAGAFPGSPLDRKDGFIHLSDAAQMSETARLHFRDRADLIVVGFDAASFGEALKWEPSRNGQLFPHLYAALPTAAALSIDDAPLDGDGAPVIPPLTP